MKKGLLALFMVASTSHAAIDLKANEQPLPVSVDP
ncbi:MAG TPA: ABC transporter substrate-binding protein, partial [Leclercia adecarboxylata]|nr:ABC transporter substrate-binding protein [Leclercia adecarboxylata]